MGCRLTGLNYPHMATVAKLVPLEEYLTSSYEPDVEYIDGRLEERNVGTEDHGEIIVALIEYFASRRQGWGVRVLADVRTQTTPTRFRIPDVLVIDAAEARHRRYVTGRPLIAIEVLSPDDTRAQYLIRIADFRMMGIADIWIFDPATRRAYAIADDGTWQEQKILVSTRRPEITVDADAIFKYLD